MVTLLMRGNNRRCQAENPLIDLFRFPRPALSSHPTMPNFILTNDDTKDVIAYILSLKTRSSRM
jgi:hypothetical protein